MSYLFMRNRLIFIFAFLFALLLLLFAAWVYIYGVKARKAEFYKRIRKQTIGKADLLLDEKVSPEIFRLIYDHSHSDLYWKEFAVYDTMLNLFYQDNPNFANVVEVQALAHEILRKGEVHFSQRDLEIDGFLHTRDGKSFFVITAATDVFGKMQLVSLKQILIISFLIAGLVVLVLLIYSRTIIKKDICLFSPLLTFDSFLEWLNKANRAQKRLVNNILLELRATITEFAGILDPDYDQHIDKASSNRIIERISTEMKRLEKQRKNGFIGQLSPEEDEVGNTLRGVRMDELLMEVKKVLEKANRMKVNIIYAAEIDNEAFISVRGDEYLLKVALVYLIGNVCKGSEGKTCDVIISHFDRKIILTFYCNGSILSIKDVSILFKPEQSEEIDEISYRYGQWISLSLSRSIIRLHGGTIDKVDRSEADTLFTITFMLDA